MQQQQDTLKRRWCWQRRPGLTVLAGVLLLVLGWLAIDLLRDWWDERCLNEYLLQLEQREPDWRNRTFGRPWAGKHQSAFDILKAWQKSTESDNAAWMVYRETYFNGLGHDPLLPAVLFTAEQAAFLQWMVRQFQPFYAQASLLDNDEIFPLWFDASLSTVKMDTQAFRVFNETYCLHEFIELQFFDALQRNDPTTAVTALARLFRERRRKQWPEPLHHNNTHPGFVERLLNLTEPGDSDLKLIQDMLQRYLDEAPEQFRQLGAEYRRLTRAVDELSRTEVSDRDIIHGRLNWIVPRESMLRQAWLKPVMLWYGKTRAKQLYRRTAFLSLKLHQLADRVEELARHPEPQRWGVWKEFATKYHFPLTAKDYLKGTRPDTSVLPEVLEALVARGMTVINLMEKLAMHRIALALIIAERYRRSTGKLPTSWEELVPAYLSAPMMDPYTGQPLKIQRQDDKIIIYSLGATGVEDAVKRWNTLNHWQFGWNQARELDGLMGLQLYVPAKRRQSPANGSQESNEAINKWKEYEEKKSGK